MANDSPGAHAAHPAPQLTAADRGELKARAHHLHPVVIVGDAGLTDAVLAETDRALNVHELIKVRIVGDDRTARLALRETFTVRLGCVVVQAIGKVLVLWRPRAGDEAEPTAGARRPKRSIPKKRLEARSEARAVARKATPAGRPASTAGRPAGGRISAPGATPAARGTASAPSAPSTPSAASGKGRKGGGVTAGRDPDFGARADERRARAARNQQNAPAGRTGRGGTGGGTKGMGTGSGSTHPGSRGTGTGSASRPTTRRSTKVVGSPPASAGRGRTPASAGSARPATARLARLKPSGGRGSGR